jgi:hypothetical protein
MKPSYILSNLYKLKEKRSTGPSTFLTQISFIYTKAINNNILWKKMQQIYSQTGISSDT